MTATATLGSACPKCGGAMWDNRATKKNPKQPDFKCRDKGCDGVIWPPRGAVKTEYNAGADLPYETPAERADYAKNGAAPVNVVNVGGTTVAPSVEKFDKLASLYTKCLVHVLGVAAPALNTAEVGTTPEAIVAATATLFIAAAERGLGS